MQALFSTLRRVAGRLGAIGAALLLAILIGGTIVGLILVHRGGTSTASPAAAPISVYVGSADASVYKLNTQKGTLRWHAQIGSQMAGDQVIAPPVVVNGSVYVSLLNGMGKSLVALNAANGAVRWRGQVESKTASEATVANGIVYVTGGGFVYAFSATNGTLRWHFYLQSVSAVTVDHGLVYVAGGGPETGILYALDAASGAVRWHAPTPDAGEEFFAPQAINGVIYTSLVSTSAGEARQEYSEYAFDDRTGTPLWKSPVLTGSIADTVPTWANGKLFISMADGNLVALNATTGAQLWSYEPAEVGSVEAFPGTAPWVVGQVVYLGYGNVVSPAAGSIVALNTSDGSPRWQQSIPGYTGTPFALAADILYVGSSDGFIHALKTTDGRQIWQYHYLHPTQDVSFDPFVSVTAAP